MVRRTRAEKLKEICLVVALLASIGFGALVGFFWEKLGQKEGEAMKDRTGGWVFAVMIIMIVVVQRMIDQVMGIGFLTSYTIEIIPEFVVDTSQYARAIYVPIEMGMALLAVCVTEYQLQRIQPSLRTFGWLGGMVATMYALGALHWQPAVVFLAIGAISLVAGLRSYGKNVTALWVEVEKGIITGCLLGGSLRYGFTFGCLAVITAWVVQDRCLWIGTLLGALIDRAKATQGR